MLGVRNPLRQQNLHLIFTISLILKGAFALFEALGGVLAYFVSQLSLLNFVNTITGGELAEDPQDIIANFLRQSAQLLSVSSQRFIAFYLLSHGVIKLLLIIGLLSRKLWCYPSAIFVFGVFIVYQLYRFSYTHSTWLLLITILDAVVIWLTWHEWKFLRRTSAAQ